MSMKINSLEIENVKRVKSVKLQPKEAGLTILGGDNNQGKTSVLDAIAWALGGNKYKPSKAAREGSAVAPKLHIRMSNGLIVERAGKNSSLKVIDPNGQKGGQQLLNSFVEELAINLPKFMEMNNHDKAQQLLQIIGVGDQLLAFEKEESEVYNRRHEIGKIADQKKKYANEQQFYPDAPKEPVSASELIQQQQTILAKNGENQRKRDQLRQLQQQNKNEKQQLLQLQEQIERLNAELETLRESNKQTVDDILTAQKTVAMLQDESTAELEQSMTEIDDINRKVRANLDKDKAEDDANEYKHQYDLLSKQLDDIRSKKAHLLSDAELPLPGLSVDDGELIYNGQKWDNMSGSDQLKVSTAIVRKLKPQCGFVLLDKLEQMDMTTLNEFGTWLEQENLQAIATRVSTGGECSIIISDGYGGVDTATNEAIAEEEPAAEASDSPWQGKGAF
ncbi:hypothetical protein LFYK43_14090 [Ligilactobacillus salitolerans]|uniref:Rad50/SbcC-type AAA domain-containing protein n=1 Tax=Ligilactobacillus salitolerans TaxID=1808352 RepID=A0A401ITS8_9LACO|nr:ATP-binding protein [Ligilactobacillus salitolerans]GBG94950.1 hypothetical protein LFYK43_14090 [Ligilactobacillus salitolerans]